MKFILASLLIGAMCLSVEAQEAVSVLGYGSTTCHTWIIERRGGSYSPLALHAWITGYLSGAAPPGSPTLLERNDEAIVDGWIDNYCDGHQLASLYEATAALANELLRYRAKSSN
jgi:hypothetical protein